MPPRLPRWVKLRHRLMSASRQLYSRKQTTACAAISVAMGQSGRQLIYSPACASLAHAVEDHSDQAATSRDEGARPAQHVYVCNLLRTQNLSSKTHQQSFSLFNLRALCVPPKETSIVRCVNGVGRHRHDHRPQNGRRRNDDRRCYQTTRGGSAPTVVEGPSLD